MQYLPDETDDRDETGISAEKPLIVNYKKAPAEKSCQMSAWSYTSNLDVLLKKD